MPPMRKSVSATSEGEMEASRLRAMLSAAFEDVPEEPEAAPEAARGPLPGSSAEEAGDDRPDWSVTLDNVGRMVALLRDHGAQLAAAEARAAAAEARATEAETWLRRLHQAVLDGLPTPRRA